MYEEEFVNQIRFMFSSEEAKGLFDRMGMVLHEKEPEPKSIVWEPERGDSYYCVLADGEVWELNWNDCLTDKSRLKHHSIYKTRELAEKAAPHLTRFNMVLQAVLDLEPDQVVDWNNKDQSKFQVYFDFDAGRWKQGWTCFEQGYPVLTDEKNMQHLLNYLNSKEKGNG